MKKGTRRAYEYYLRIPFAVFLFAAAIAFIVCGIIKLTEAVLISDVIVAIFAIIGALAVFGMGIHLIRSVTVFVELNDDGLVLYHQKKPVVNIKWDEINEVGIGKAETTSGEVKKLYFSSSELDDKLRYDLDKAQSCTVYFRRLQPQWYEFIKEHSPLPIPESARHLDKTTPMEYTVRTSNGDGTYVIRSEKLG